MITVLAIFQPFYEYINYKLKAILFTGSNLQSFIDFCGVSVIDTFVHGNDIA